MTDLNCSLTVFIDDSYELNIASSFVKSCRNLQMKELFNTRCLGGLIAGLILPTLRRVMPVFSVSRTGLFAKMFSVTAISLYSLLYIMYPPHYIFLCFILGCFHFRCRITPISRGSNSLSVRFTYSTAVLCWWYHLPCAWTSQFPAASALPEKAFLRHPNFKACSNTWLIK